MAWRLSATPVASRPGRAPCAGDDTASRLRGESPDWRGFMGPSREPRSHQRGRDGLTTRDMIGRAAESTFHHAESKWPKIRAAAAVRLVVGTGSPAAAIPA